MEIVFNSEEKSELQSIIARYPEKKAALMPVLWMAQRKFGWLSTDVQRYVADLLGLSYSHVQGVTSFYTMFFKKPVGRYHIQVCTNVSCMLNEGEEILNYVSGKLGIASNERSPDGKFSLEEVECMGACGGAPMIAINENYYENIGISRLEEILSSLE